MSKILKMWTIVLQKLGLKIDHVHKKYQSPNLILWALPTVRRVAPTLLVLLPLVSKWPQEYPLRIPWEPSESNSPSSSKLHEGLSRSLLMLSPRLCRDAYA